MGDYKSGYDPKYGYNRNAFAHKTIGTTIMGTVVKLIVTPIGLGSEAIHHHKDKKKRAQSDPDSVAAVPEGKSDHDDASPSENDGEAVYVKVSHGHAEELIASNQAVPADGETATHELVPEDDEHDRDEADWALDDAASETEEKDPSPAYQAIAEEDPAAQISKLSMLSANPKTDNRSRHSSSTRLPFPVILPQRRPGTKSRGFIRAYAPVLQDSGIDQDAFLTFLKHFHKAAQANPIFDVILVASAIAGAYPDPLVGLGMFAVQVMVAVGQEVQERLRTNKFLDQANKGFFIPKGLFALIVTYKPGESEQTEVGTKTMDLGASAMAKYGDGLTQTEHEEGEHEKQKMKEKMKNLRIASGEAHEADIPVTCAPLTFPALDAVDAAIDSAKKGSSSEGVANTVKTKAKSSSKFVNDYFDRRAQASYVSAPVQ